MKTECFRSLVAPARTSESLSLVPPNGRKSPETAALFQANRSILNESCESG